MKHLALLLITFSLLNCNSVKDLPFNQALIKAQNWVGSNGVYAVGESLDNHGEKLILVFAKDTSEVTKILPKVFHGHKVAYYNTGEIVPQELDQEE